MKHSEEREKDVQNLVSQILEMSTESYANQNGADESFCPFCYNRVNGLNEDISKINHKTDCAYLIAKDLKINPTPDIKADKQ